MTSKSDDRKAEGEDIVLGTEDAWLDALGQLAQAVESMKIEQKDMEHLQGILARLKNAADPNDSDAAKGSFLSPDSSARSAGLFKRKRSPGRPVGSKTRRSKATSGMQRARELILLKASGFKPNEAAKRVASDWPGLDITTVFHDEERNALALLYLELFKDEGYALDIIRNLDEEIVEQAKKYRGMDPDELAKEWVADLGENEDPAKVKRVMTIMAYCWVKLASLAKSADS